MMLAFPYQAYVLGYVFQVKTPRLVLQLSIFDPPIDDLRDLAAPPRAGGGVVDVGLATILPRVPHSQVKQLYP